MLDREQSAAVVIAIVLAVTVAIITAVLVATLPADVSRDDLDPGPACIEWTDDCVVCQRMADGTPACSTPGIACTRGSLRCLRRS